MTVKVLQFRRQHWPSPRQEMGPVLPGAVMAQQSGAEKAVTLEKIL